MIRAGDDNAIRCPRLESGAAPATRSPSS